MKEFTVEFQTNDSSRWVGAGKFRAKTACGAISQFMKDAKFFPNLIAVRAI